MLSTSLFSQPKRGSVGKISFYFDNGGKLKNPMRVFYYSPKADADDLPIVIMLHGAERDASNYLNGLMETANKLGCKIIAPEFDAEDFYGPDSYNLGNVYNRIKKKYYPSDQWTFSLIEPLFDMVVKETQSSCKAYYLYGHSAGAQFVHRYLMFADSPRVIRAAFANAGWYTMPDFNEKFPYGIYGSPIDQKKLEAFFSYNTCVLVGVEDKDRNGIAFNVSAEAEEQGKNRFERGNYYYKYCKELAAKMSVPFNWSLTHVPNVGHDNEKMGVIGLPCLLGLSKD
jgi:pimeloyl-ACP methyl ester carboxylesterase